jgi:hypothetical protein
LITWQFTEFLKKKKKKNKYGNRKDFKEERSEKGDGSKMDAMICLKIKKSSLVKCHRHITKKKWKNDKKKRFEKKAIKATTLDDKDYSSITSNDDDSSDLEKLENRGLIVEFEEESSLEELMTMMGGVTPLTTTRQ